MAEGDGLGAKAGYKGPMAISPERREELRKIAKENVARLVKGRTEKTSPQEPKPQKDFLLGVPGYGRIRISASSLEEAKQKFKVCRPGDYSIEEIWDVDPGDRLRDPEYAKEHQRKAKAWADWEARVSRASSLRLECTYTGPRGGRYRINSNGRKSYDVP